ncbi:hypothetical protein Krac_11698 [Ktedonobacter racemifer DSM 44963]|uniref:Uncharacterized protein n=1 Tax=Ktedonobacter racemifer DSM 44963 TaxID=485913 RepID=D6TD39_KTERA|nr:hypothetical protein Krac_11698 [Ktedonobacter racemifer DSM 44963]
MFPLQQKIFRDSRIFPSTPEMAYACLRLFSLLSFKARYGTFCIIQRVVFRALHHLRA